MSSNMVILFSERTLKKISNSDSALKREYGSRQAKEIRARLDEARDLPNLKAWYAFPQARMHNLTGDRKKQFAVDLVHPYRLVFEPAGKFETSPDGGIDTATVRAIRIIEIVNYHD